MRITIVQGYHLPVPPVMGGAVEKVWYVLGREFARRGHQVLHVSCRHPDLPDEELREGVRHLRIPGARRPASGLLHAVRDLAYSRRARSVLPEADILVSNTFWLPILVRSKRFGRLYIHAARQPRGQYRWYLHADRVQGPARALMQAIGEQRPELVGRLLDIPNPLPWPVPDAVPDPADRAPCVLFVGRLHPEKGLDLLCRGFARFLASHAQWRLRIVGPGGADGGGGGEAFVDDLKRRYADLPIDWTGPIYDADKLQACYASARIFAYPTLAELGEALPLAPVEAMSWGAVPVLSDIPCFRQYVVPGRNGEIIDHRGEGAAERLAEAFARLADHPERLAEASRAARAAAVDYTVERIAGRFLEDFAGLLAGAAPLGAGAVEQQAS